MKQKILVSGSLAYDKIMNFNGRFAEHIMADKIHSLSVSFVVDKIKVNFGGTAGNIAYNLKLLGKEPVILSQAGGDFVSYRKWLGKNKIGIEGIKIIKNKNTATAHIMTDRDDNQITALYLETMGIASGISERKIKKFLPAAMAIVAPGNKRDMIAAADIYKKLEMPYVVDPGQQIPALRAGELDFLIKKARALVVNDYEFELVKKKIKKTKEQIKKMVDILVVTYGDKGSVIYSQGRVIKIKTVKTRKLVDPTGAGDAYRAGLVRGLVSGWDLARCGQLASWVAKHPVEFYGTQEHKFKLADFGK